MSVLDDLVTGRRADFIRDQWQRPLIMQASGERVPYTRMSNATKGIEDEWNLNRWRDRNIAYGMAHDASLPARVLAHGGSPATWDKGDKEVVTKIVNDALVTAKAHTGADIGTAIHRLIQRKNSGETIQAGPYQADIDAYYREIERCRIEILPQFLEVHLVCDELELAGSADNIVIGDSNEGRVYRIADLKTGATVNYGALSFSGQLGGYGNGLLYDVDKEHRLPTPDLDKDTGYIIHLPAGQGRCGIYTIDIERGYKAARLAAQVRRAQKAAPSWLQPVRIAAPATPPAVEPGTTEGVARTSSVADVLPPDTEIQRSTDDHSDATAVLPPVPDAVGGSTDTGGVIAGDNGNGRTSSVSVDRPNVLDDDGVGGGPLNAGPYTPRGVAAPSRAIVVERAKALVAAGHGLRLANSWPEGVPGLKTDHAHSLEELIAIMSAVRSIEDETSAPFHPADAPPPDLTTPTPPPVVVRPQLDPAADLVRIDDSSYEALKRAYEALPEKVRAPIDRIAAEAHDAGVPINNTQARSRRRWEIIRALVLWCRYGWDDNVIADLLADGDDAPYELAIAVGLLTIERAAALADQAQRLLDGGAVLRSDTGLWTVVDAPF